MTDYQDTKNRAEADGVGWWSSTIPEARHVLAYGPVSFRGTSLYQEVLWRHKWPQGQPSDRLFCSTVLVEDLYKDHG